MRRVSRNWKWSITQSFLCWTLQVTEPVYQFRAFLEMKENSWQMKQALKVTNTLILPFLEISSDLRFWLVTRLLSFALLFPLTFSFTSRIHLHCRPRCWVYSASNSPTQAWSLSSRTSISAWICLHEFLLLDRMVLASLPSSSSLLRSWNRWVFHLFSSVFGKL